MPTYLEQRSFPPLLPNRINDSPEQADVIFRGIAFFIDHMLITFAIVATAFASMTRLFSEEPDLMGSFISTFAILPIGVGIYVFKDSFRGRSFGKWLLNLQVRDTKDLEQIPSTGRLILRNLPIFIWPIELLSLILSSDQRRFGDKWAMSTVVKTETTAPRKVKVMLMLSVGFVLFASTFIFTFSMIKNNDAYRAAIAEIEQTQAIIDKTGGITGYGALPAGHIQTKNGEGKATFTISVKGKKKNISVKAHLSKSPDSDWSVHKLKY